MQDLLKEGIKDAVQKAHAVEYDSIARSVLFEQIPLFDCASLDISSNNHNSVWSDLLRDATLKFVHDQQTPNEEVAKEWASIGNQLKKLFESNTQISMGHVLNILYSPVRRQFDKRASISIRKWNIDAEKYFQKEEEEEENKRQRDIEEAKRKEEAKKQQEEQDIKNELQRQKNMKQAQELNDKIIREKEERERQEKREKEEQERRDVEDERIRKEEERKRKQEEDEEKALFEATERARKADEEEERKEQERQKKSREEEEKRILEQQRVQDENEKLRQEQLRREEEAASILRGQQEAARILKEQEEEAERQRMADEDKKEETEDIVLQGSPLQSVSYQEFIDGVKSVMTQHNSSWIESVNRIWNVEQSEGTIKQWPIKSITEDNDNYSVQIKGITILEKNIVEHISNVKQRSKDLMDIKSTGMAETNDAGKLFRDAVELSRKLVIALYNFQSLLMAHRDETFINEKDVNKAARGYTVTITQKESVKVDLARFATSIPTTEDKNRPTKDFLIRIFKNTDPDAGYTSANLYPAAKVLTQFKSGDIYEMKDLIFTTKKGIQLDERAEYFTTTLWRYPGIGQYILHCLLKIDYAIVSLLNNIENVRYKEDDKNYNPIKEYFAENATTIGDKPEVDASLVSHNEYYKFVTFDNYIREGYEKDVNKFLEFWNEIDLIKEALQDKVAFHLSKYVNVEEVLDSKYRLPKNDNLNNFFFQENSSSIQVIDYKSEDE